MLDLASGIALGSWRGTKVDGEMLVKYSSYAGGGVMLLHLQAQQSLASASASVCRHGLFFF